MYHLNSLLRYKETTLLNGRAGIHRLAWDQRPNIYDVQEKFGYSRFEPAPTNQAWQSSFLTKQQQENFLVKFWRRLPIIPRRLILEFVGTVHPQRVVSCFLKLFLSRPIGFLATILEKMLTLIFWRRFSLDDLNTSSPHLYRNQVPSQTWNTIFLPIFCHAFP